MIVVMRPDASEPQIKAVDSTVHELGYRTVITHGELQTIVAITGDTTRNGGLESLGQMEGVENTIRVMKEYKQASREFHPFDTVVRVGDVEIGGDRVVLMVGPCAVESSEQLLETARAVRHAGFPILRGGAFKPRTSPYRLPGTFSGRAPHTRRSS